ncbi:hypothetical protein [Nocardioides sp.]|uniref:hypothetical protein n=1 Tax=Nocardioides sp. TaxID=35761 RepID=UPI0035674507
MATSDPTLVDLTPPVLNIRIVESDGWDLQITVGTEDPETSEVAPTDLSGYTITYQFRDKSGTVSDLEYTPTDLTNGVFTVAQDTVAVSGRYLIRLTPPDGVRRSVYTGRVDVVPDLDDD